MSEGWVYILSNKSFKRQIKIGFTTGDPKVASELYTTSLTPFKVEYQILVSDCEKVEKLAHEELRSFRVAKNREFSP